VTEDVLSRVGEWCRTEPDLSLTDRTITVGGDPPVEITVDPGPEAVTLTHTAPMADAPAGFAEQAASLLGGRGSMMSGAFHSGDGGDRLDITYPIYLDGFNRHSFLVAVREIVAAADSTRTAAAQPAAVAVAPATDRPLAPQAEPEPEPGPATRTGETVAVSAVPPWKPTHTVPGGGMPAWVEPNPELAPAATLAARVELQVVDERGAWARVVGSNGWTGWVDGRRLRPLGESSAGDGTAPVAAAAASTRAPLSIRPLMAIGGAAMIVGSFLNWLPWVKGWDVNLGFLWANASPDHPRLGLLLTILGVAAIAAALAPRLPGFAPGAIAAAGVLVTGLFIFQVLRLLANWQWQILWDGSVAIGWWIAFVGSVLTAFRFRLKA